MLPMKKYGPIIVVFKIPHQILILERIRLCVSLRSHGFL